MKKLLLLLVAMCAIHFAWAAYSFSAVAPTGQTLYYTVRGNTVEVTAPGTNVSWSGYTEPTGILSIPASVTFNSITYPVTSIGAYAFYYCSGITKVTIPNSITNINAHAFGACSGITNITIGNSVTNIGSCAFSGCTSISNVSIPNSVTSIADMAFSGCRNLTSITIPSSLTSIGSSVFEDCNGLASISVASGNTIYDSRSSCNAIIKTATNTLIQGCKNTTIPNSVTSIGDYAFFGCSDLTSMTIPNSVTSIGDCAFSECRGLTSIIIPSSVTNIGSNAFQMCENLSSVTIPDSVTSIGSSAFSFCRGLTRVSIGNSVTVIGSCAFQTCSGLTSVSIPNSVTTIGSSAFYDCSNLRSITIPNSVTSIGSSAFWGCNRIASIVVDSGNAIYDSRNNSNAIIETLTNTLIYGCKNTAIPYSVTSIGPRAFQDCNSLTNITVPNSVTTIGQNAFSGCSGLIIFSIPNSVTTIERNAFYGCRNLSSITIPSSVTNIGSNAFYNCYNLKTVYNLSNLSIANNSYGLSAKRVVTPTNYGTGDNAIHKIPNTFTIVNNVASTSATEIPYSTIPTNFIYYDNSAKDGESWKAKEIVLTDGQDAFEAPETFTAETATYTREFTNSNRSTLYLPFTAAIPENFEVYDFTSFANNTISFTKREDSIYAYTPYLVGYDLSKDGNTTTCTITKNNAVFPKSESANYHPVTRNGMTFQGVLERTEMTSTNNYGYSNGFFVQSGGHAHVNPFRSYFTYTAPAGAPQSLPPTLNVEVGYGDPVGIDAVETPEQEYDGRYGKDVYDMLGRLVRKNADNLEGLPRGIYLWMGKKNFKN